ncbi:hypothetical protein [Shewanella zhuhaiensis]|uniref:hypothetical protein n=1 Tax=Shewanella zhuhaiensis TaxID=2919576 RepID=UPI001F0C018C|nr:hypothetical protein [Shewanella zhuhaiensis]
MLNANSVNYFVTGGGAEFIRGTKTYTKDLDIVVRVDDDNIKAIRRSFDFLNIIRNKALHDLKAGRIVRASLFPFSLDVMPVLDGLDIDEAFLNIETIHFDGLAIPVINKLDLNKNYKAINHE